MNTQQARSLVAIALMAAFADGRQDTEEREHVRKVAESLGRDIEIDFIPLYQDVLLGRLELRREHPPLIRFKGRNALQLPDASGVRVAYADGELMLHADSFDELCADVAVIEIL